MKLEFLPLNFKIKSLPVMRAAARPFLWPGIILPKMGNPRLQGRGFFIAVHYENVFKEGIEPASKLQIAVLQPEKAVPDLNCASVR